MTILIIPRNECRASSSTMDEVLSIYGSLTHSLDPERVNGNGTVSEGYFRVTSTEAINLNISDE